MKIKKSDWALIRDAEQNGLMVGMTGLVERKRTDLNNKLSDHFRSKLPNYSGSYGEYEGEDVLYSINEYIKENNIDKYQLDFPFTEGTDIHLIPITENLQLKVLVADEYYGGGDYAKYVMADFFMINENATEQDVNVLIQFLNKYSLK